MEAIAPGQPTMRPLEMSSWSTGFGLTTGGQETNGDLLKRLVATVDQSITFTCVWRLLAVHSSCKTHCQASVTTKNNNCHQIFEKEYKSKPCVPAFKKNLVPYASQSLSYAYQFLASVKWYICTCVLIPPEWQSIVYLLKLIEHWA